MRISELFENIYNEVVFSRRTSAEKKLVKKARKRAHRNTNWNYTKPRKGFKRVKIGKNRYVFKRLTNKQKVVLQKIGRGLGKASYLR